MIRKLPFRTTVFLAQLAALTLVSAVFSAQTAPDHEPLRSRNTFKKPDEVVRYYCGRDASGFVWSGLLEVERKAFTLWKDLPEQDSFYVARNYEIGTANLNGPNEATVEVVYDLLGVADAHGTLVPVPQKERRVVFRLRKDQGSWKITLPEAGAISPVVLAAKFQFVGNL